MPVYQAIWQLTAAGHLEMADQALGLALEDARRRGSVVGFALASLFHSYLELARGRVAPGGVARRGPAALDAASQADVSWWGCPAVVAGLVDVYVEQGRLGEAELLLARWPEELPIRRRFVCCYTVGGGCGWRWGGRGWRQTTSSRSGAGGGAASALLTPGTCAGGGGAGVRRSGADG